MWCARLSSRASGPVVLLAFVLLPVGVCSAQDESASAAAPFESPFPSRPVLSPADSARVSELTESISKLTDDGAYSESIPLANEILEIRRRHQPAMNGVNWWETADAKQRVTDLELFATFTAEQVAELEEAEALRQAEQEARKAGDSATAVEKSSRLLELRFRLLGENHIDTISAVAALAANKGRVGASAESESLYAAMKQICLSSIGMWHPHTAVAFGGVGLIESQHGDFEASEISARAALTIREACYGEDHVAVANALRGLSGALVQQGEFAEAEPLLLRSLAILYRAHGDEHEEVAATLNHLGVLHQSKGDWAKAEPYLTESLAINRKLFGRDHWGTVVGITGLATVKMNQGGAAEAEPMYREALSIVRELFGESSPYVASLMTNLAAALSWQEKYEEAAALQEEIVELSRQLQGEDHPHVAHALYNLGITTMRMGQYARSDSAQSQALDIRRRVLGNDHPMTIMSLELLSSARIGLGDFDSAESLLVEACQLYESARAKTGRGIGQATFVRPPYPELAAARLFQGKTNGVWEAWERSRCRVLGESIQEVVDLQLTPDLAARRDSLSKRLSRAEQLVASCQAVAKADSTQAALQKLEDARLDRFEHEAEWGALQAEIARQHPIREGLVYSLAEVQATLDRESAIVGWVDREVLVGHYVCWGYVVRDEGPVFWAPVVDSAGEPVTTKEHPRVHDWRAQLADPWSSQEELDHHTQHLMAGRITPLLPALDGVQKLIVIPSGAMLSVPIEALRDETGTWLADRFTISYEPAATIRVWLAAMKDSARSGDRAVRRALLLGDPPFNENHLAAMEEGQEGDGLLAMAATPDKATLRSALSGDAEALASMPRLPGTRAEVSTLASIVPDATILLGPDASEQRVFALNEDAGLSDFSVLHFATHALVDVENPSESCLLLARTGLSPPLDVDAQEGRMYDGLLTAREIAREWKLDADLVTLSACETGLGQDVGDEGVVGFVHTFLQAGARSLLVSLWRVEDLATSLLMHRFYNNWWGSGLTKAESLREAKSWLRSLTIEEVSNERTALGLTGMTSRGGGDATTRPSTSEYRPYAHPNFWAGFVLFGEAD